MENRAIVILSFVIILAFCGCNENEPDNRYVGCNKHDVLILKTILKHCGYSEEDSTQYGNMTVTAIDKYQVAWRWDNGSAEKRIKGLGLFKNNETDYTLPACISELSELKEITVYGGFKGDFPNISSLTKLDNINIIKTSLESLPDDLFTPQFRNVCIYGNKKIKRLPSSVLLLPSQIETGSTIPYYLFDNGFEGSMLLKPYTCMVLQNNNFTEIDWRYAESLYCNLSLREYANIRYYRSSITHNLIGGEIPDRILSDSLGLYWLIYDADPQRDGMTFSNAPEWSEIVKRKNEYIKNHPEYNR